jgi:hypothetical protein
LGSLAAVLAMPLDRASSKSPIFSALWAPDEVLLVAMALLLDAYMQWFHIGSYRLAKRFSQLGGLVRPKEWAAFGQNRKFRQAAARSLGHTSSIRHGLSYKPK